MRPGFTLAEATMALVILGFAAAGVLLPFAGGASVQAEGGRRTLAAELANDLMERIVTTPFEDIQAAWDHPDAYTWTYSEPQGQMKDAGGIALTDGMYDEFSRDASYCLAYVRQQFDKWSLMPLPPAPNFVLVSVTVHYRGRQLATVSRLIDK